MGRLFIPLLMLIVDTHAFTYITSPEVVIGLQVSEIVAANLCDLTTSRGILTC